MDVNESPESLIQPTLELGWVFSPVLGHLGMVPALQLLKF